MIFKIQDFISFAYYFQEFVVFLMLCAWVDPSSLHNSYCSVIVEYPFGAVNFISPIIFISF